MLSVLLAKKNLKLIFGLGVILLPTFSYAQFAFEGPIPAITSGYGSFGSAPIQSDFFQLVPDSTMECNDTVRCIITYPEGVTSETPTVFYFPGSSNTNRSDSAYWKVSQFYREFVASNGYISVTMQYNGENTYGCAYYLLDEAVKRYGHMIDTTKVGIHGMSQGAAVTNWLSLKKYINDGWGANGRFAWPDAGATFIGWLTNWPEDIETQTDSGLAAMPDDVLYLTTYSDWDQTPDPRTLIDMYNFMGVPDSNKEFMIIRGDTINNYIYWATHFTTNTYVPDSLQFYVNVTKHDALDYWLGSRLLHALMGAAWDKDPLARRICMGDGDTLQTQIAGGALRGPIVTDKPWMTMIASWNSGQGYMNPCTVSWNMRQYVTADACFILSVPEADNHPQLKVYPNPARTFSRITIESDLEIEHVLVVNEIGQRIAEFNSNSIRVENAGAYYLGITFVNGQRTAVKLNVRQ